MRVICLAQEHITMTFEIFLETTTCSRILNFPSAKLEVDKFRENVEQLASPSDFSVL